MFFRLDYNTDIGRAGAQDSRLGFEENTLWRHYQAIYAMYGRLRRRFPKLMMENCAGGGGRNDLGMLQNFNWAQVSDEWGGVKNLEGLKRVLDRFPTRIRVELCGFHESGKLSLRRHRLPIPGPDVRPALPRGDRTGSSSLSG